MFSQRASMASSEHLLLPSLPFELIEVILYRTPTESLIRFKSTCKKWYNLISDKRFMYNHLDNSPERFLRFDNHERVQIMDPVTGIISVTPTPNVSRNSFPSMVHCDGLLMLRICYRGIHYPNLAVWNPVLRKIKWIEPSVRCWYSYCFGIGYNNKASRDNYKILCVSYSDDDDDDDDEESDPKSQIYEFKSDSWRTIDAKFDGDLDIVVGGVSVNGNMYWIDVEKEKKKHFIISFDFSMEKFKHICVSPHYWNIKRLGCFNGDRLSLLQQHEETGEIHVSVTNKLSDEVVSFSRYFNVTLPDLPMLRSQYAMALPGWSIGKHRNIMAWCEQLVEEDDNRYISITLYEIDERGVRKQIETGRHGPKEYDDSLIYSYVYVPSLIPVPE